MDTKALQLNSRFALPPNSLGYCGKDSAPEKFKSCVTKGDCKSAADEFKHFIVLWPYLKTISKITELPKLSYQAVESYWLGNDSLKKAKNKDYPILLGNFAKQGVPKWLVEELKSKKPSKFIPTHLFQVLHVGVGRASGSVPYNIETINNCMVRWGKVTKMGKTQVMVELNSLKKVGKSFRLTKLEEKASLVPDFVPDLKLGETVIVHWKQMIKRLEQSEIEKIAYWTKEVLQALNE
jgi:hypothetical protein